MADTIKGEYYYGMGRRKTAVARVRLYPNGDGSITVNGKSAQAYFGTRETPTATINAPLRLLELGNAYSMSVRVVGGGTSGQAGAIRHADPGPPGETADRPLNRSARYSPLTRSCLAV